MKDSRFGFYDIDGNGHLDNLEKGFMLSDIIDEDMSIASEHKKHSSGLIGSSINTDSKNSNLNTMQSFNKDKKTASLGCAAFVLIGLCIIAVIVINVVCTHSQKEASREVTTTYNETYYYQYSILDDDSIVRDATPDSAIDMPYKGMDEKYMYSTSIGKADDAFTTYGQPNIRMYLWFDLRNIDSIEVTVVDGKVTKVDIDYSYKNSYATTTVETTTAATTRRSSGYYYSDGNDYDDEHEYEDDEWEDYFDDEEYDDDGWEPDD